MLLLSLLACSFTRFDYTPCTAHDECREAFGFGSVCGEDGLCTALAPNPRCDAWPVDLFERPEAYTDVLVVGSLFDHSTDVPEIQSVRLAVDQANGAQGLDGHEFALLQCSYEEDPALDALTMEEATAATSVWLADEVGAPVIVGPATSSQAEVAYSALNRERDLGTVLISPSATSPALTDIDGVVKTDEDPGLFWRTVPPDSLQGAVMARDIAERGSQDVAVIYEAGPYGEGLAVAFSEVFEGTGGRYTLLPYSDEGQRAEAVTAASDRGFDEVVFISGEITHIIAFLESAGALSAYDDRPLFLTDGARDLTLLQEVSGGRHLLDQVRGTAPATPSGPNYKTFAGAYGAAYEGDATDSVFTSYTYDATWLGLYGSAWAWYQGAAAEADAQGLAPERAVVGPDVARGLRKLSSGDEIVIRSTGWPDVLSRFEAGSSVDVEGASGHLDYDPDTEETTAAIDIWVVNAAQDGFETQYTVEP